MDSSSYNWLERLLHAIALNPLAAEASFDLEQSLIRPDPEAAHYGRHVFIACLARAGSTALLEALNSTGQFRSLTYRDMPFVLMPTTWRRLSARHQKTSAPVERAHGDGIAISVESPEAFEQVFWGVFAGNSHIKADRLIPHEADAQTLDKFRRFVAAVLASAGSPEGLYLSKNNNNVLRLPSIRRAFPNCLIIVLYRDPVQHALSLLNQHRRFTAQHREDKFARRYMSWLAHHEFGLTHKPFIFEPDEAKALGALDPDAIDYWVALWTNTYSHLINNAPPDTLWLKFEDFCAAPNEVVEEILKRAGRQSALMPSGQGFEPPLHPAPKDIQPELLQAALRIHQRLDALALPRLRQSAGDQGSATA